MTHRYQGFLDFLSALNESVGHFRVVAREELSVAGSEGGAPPDLPVSEVFAEDGDKEICILRTATGAGLDDALRLSVFYATLKELTETYPDYSLMISEKLAVNEEFNARADFPMRGADVDEEREVVRLLF